MPPPSSATDHYRRQLRIADATAGAARSTWARLNPVDLNRSYDVLVGPRLNVLAAAAQRAAAVDATRYVTDVIDDLDLDAPPVARTATVAFAGTASDGRPLATLLRQPLVATLTAIDGGVDLDTALRVGASSLDRIIRTQLADAARGATSVGITARPAIDGYVRMLSAPSCSRCALLAGKWYRWNEGFLRHPRCDCRHIPASESIAGDLTTDPVAAYNAGHVTGLTAAERRALDDGADFGQVVNSRRGMTTAGTSEGTTRRGAYGQQRRREGTAGPRLRPEQVYRLAGDDRTAAIALLRRYGYLV